MNERNELDMNLQDLPEEENDDVVELVDENGESTFFEHLATLEYNGESYLALCDPEADDDNLEVFIMKIETDENGGDIYTIPEDSVADAVFEQFTSLLDDLQE